MQATSIQIYTDGSARNNPGRGGYGAILIFGNYTKSIAQGYKHTTNNRMEIMGVIEALKLIKQKELPITIYSDSRYVVDAISLGWVNKWLRTHFKGDKKNPDLWLQYSLVAQGLTVTMEWVKGHAENPYNNQCDILATNAADDRQNLKDDAGYGNEINTYQQLMATNKFTTSQLS